MDKELERKAALVNKFMEADAPRIVANEGVNYFKESFEKEGYGNDKWKDVKRRTHPSQSEKGKAAASRKILTGPTGDLGESIDYNKNFNDGKIQFQTDIEYAQAHNEGTSNAGRGNSTMIPQRQFMPFGGQPLPEELKQEIKEKLDERFNAIFNSK